MMKQILQSLKTGETEVANVPLPRVSKGSLLIQTSCTLISTGTERMLIDFGKAGWIAKARQQPDKLRIALDKVKTDGLQPTIEAILNKLDQPLPVGYCNVGIISEVGSSFTGFEIGDRVISNGKHAEMVNVPVNLCVKVPEAVSDEEAAFTVLGAIALQGVRLAQPTLGETIVVTGLGLVGLMTVQLLRANGCRVLGLDFDSGKLALAKQFGAEVVDLSQGQDPVVVAESFSRGRGVDAVVITASTKSNEPVHQAALMCRKRGRIVLVGVTGLELSRDDFFKKELTFQVSASYGPGRYDPNYEEKGHDYPIGFVRWTEQRNFEAVLDMMAMGKLDVKSLISHRFQIDDARNAYALLSGSESTLGIMLSYPGIEINEQSRKVEFDKSGELPKNDSARNSSSLIRTKLSFIGSGNYASSVLIPAFKHTGVEFVSVASSQGASGVHVGKKFGFAETTTDPDSIFSDISTDAVVITTRHNSHAAFVQKALRSSKHVFVEKPLCLNLEELKNIEDAYDPAKILMVGFNRRFAPQIQKIKTLLGATSGPKSFMMTVNAGAIPPDHWTQDLDVGGGRIVGEACHFIDLLRFLAGAQIREWKCAWMDSRTKDSASIQLVFKDGSIGTVHYFANGPKSFPKERLEVFVDGRVLKLDNFRKLSSYGWKGFKKMNLWKQDKGQKNCCDAFVQAVANGESAPIPIDEIIEVSRVSIEIAQSF
jgi:predicted dehydrogenase/threonine dehydrogenase-like Zn-dependent dehydrogenase